MTDIEQCACGHAMAQHIENICDVCGCNIHCPAPPPTKNTDLVSRLRAPVGPALTMLERIYPDGHRDKIDPLYHEAAGEIVRLQRLLAVRQSIMKEQPVRPCGDGCPGCDYCRRPTDAPAENTPTMGPIIARCACSATGDKAECPIHFYT
jgi:hypothetical protein